MHPLHANMLRRRKLYSLGTCFWAKQSIHTSSLFTVPLALTGRCRSEPRIAFHLTCHAANATEVARILSRKSQTTRKSNQSAHAVTRSNTELFKTGLACVQTRCKSATLRPRFLQVILKQSFPSNYSLDQTSSNTIVAAV